MSDILRILARPDLHIPGLQVEPDLQLEVLHHGLEDLHPVLLEGGIPVPGYWNLPHLTAVSELLSLDGRECGLSLENII